MDVWIGFLGYMFPLYPYVLINVMGVARYSFVRVVNSSGKLT